MSHVTISGFLCDPISGHVISAPISGHIETDIDTDIGYTPISGHFLPISYNKYPIAVLISGPISGCPISSPMSYPLCIRHKIRAAMDRAKADGRPIDKLSLKIIKDILNDRF